MPRASDASVIRFGVFEADLRSGELRKSGVKIRLREQAFQVLSELLERPGEVVTREELRDRLWPDGTFVDFDHSLNAAVNSIREVLGDSAASPRFVETLPRRGYRFVGPVEKREVKPPIPPRPVIWAVSFIALVAVAASSYLFLSGPEHQVRPSPQKTYITSYPGHEIQPSFSPDASQVTFAWGGEPREDSDIYVKLIGVEPPRQITDNPLNEYNPVWSPDGRWIAFVRKLDESSAEVRLVDPYGNRERKLAEVSAVASFRFRHLAWSPNSKELVVVDKAHPADVSGLFLMSIDTGEKRQLTAPPPGAFFDANPAFSPGGRQLAFIRFSLGAPVGDLYVLDPSRDQSPEGDIRRLATSDKGVVAGWTPEGKHIIYATSQARGGDLLRVGVSGGGEPELIVPRLSIGFLPAPALSPDGQRLAYSEQVDNTAITRLEMPEGAGQPVLTKLIGSTRLDLHAEYSPDGDRIAFASNRSGRFEVWSSDRDGSNPVQLTSMSFPWCSSVHWSPDGHRILFTAIDAESSDIRVVDSEGGGARALVSGPSDDLEANWSRDGESIYFTSNRSGQFQVWNVRPGGGDPVQVTTSGGANGIESVSGEWLFYIKDHFPEWETSLWKVPVHGGREEKVLESVMRNYVPMEDGIFFFSQTHPTHAPDPSDAYLQFHRFGSRETEVIARVEMGYKDHGLSVSPDGRSFLFTDEVRSGSDLVMLEDFQ